MRSWFIKWIYLSVIWWQMIRQTRWPFSHQFLYQRFSIKSPKGPVIIHYNTYNSLLTKAWIIKMTEWSQQLPFSISPLTISISISIKCFFFFFGSGASHYHFWLPPQTLYRWDTSCFKFDMENKCILLCICLFCIMLLLMIFFFFF